MHEHGVKRLADIRRFPGSRRHPHFSRESLERELPIEYVHFEDLGGRREPVEGSPNGAWENEQFRGYADYMGTTEFRDAVERLIGQAESLRYLAVMCAEAVPWRCHRNLLSDELVRRGVEVLHIVGAGPAKAHALSKMARIDGDRVIYPPEQSAMF